MGPMSHRKHRVLLHRRGRVGLCVATCLLAAAAHAQQRAPDGHPGLDALRRQAFAEVDRQREALVALSDEIWRLAETSLRELRSSAALADYLERHGFAVERGVAGLPTAFVASWGRGAPVIGVLAEFDALPGIGNRVEPRRAPTGPNAAGHGCGHNLFGAASAGAAVAAKTVLERHGLPGTIRLFGCPAEETVIGKVYMAREGVFDGLDVCLDWHPSAKTGVDLSSSRAMNSFEVRFHGRTAHGAADPWNGRSALDAVELMNHAVNMLREHVRPTVRIHYVVTDGGGAPNVVPDHAAVWYYVRDLTREGVERTYERILKCAQGAAIATETTHEVRLLSGVHSYLLDRALSRVLDRNLRAAGAPRWTPAQQEFARAIQRATGKPEKGLFEGIEALPEEEQPAKGGSTDVAEVSRIVPTAKLRVAAAPLETPWHAWPVVACAGGDIGHAAMICAARTLAATAVELAVTPQAIRAAKREFLEKTKGKAYRSPLPPDQRPPLPNPR